MYNSATATTQPVINSFAGNSNNVGANVVFTVVFNGPMTVTSASIYNGTTYTLAVSSSGTSTATFTLNAAPYGVYTLFSYTVSSVVNNYTISYPIQTYLITSISVSPTVVYPNQPCTIAITTQYVTSYVGGPIQCYLISGGSKYQFLTPGQTAGGAPAVNATTFYFNFLMPAVTSISFSSAVFKDINGVTPVYSSGAAAFFPFATTALPTITNVTYAGSITVGTGGPSVTMTLSNDIK